MKYYVISEVWGTIEAENEEEAVEKFMKSIDFEGLNGDFDILEIEKWGNK